MGVHMDGKKKREKGRTENKHRSIEQGVSFWQLVIYRERERRGGGGGGWCAGRHTQNGKDIMIEVQA